MSISPASSSATSPLSANPKDDAASRSTAVGDKAGEKAGESLGSIQRQAQQDMNAKILQSHLEVSIKAGDESTALLFRTAIDKINGMLEPELGPDAIQAAAKSQDNSPEATAGRIVALSTAFYSSYVKGHAGEDSGAMAKNFVELIRSGFEKGYGEATDILKGLGVFGGNVESEVSKTHELVNKGLDKFLAARLKDGEAQSSTATAAKA